MTVPLENEYTGNISHIVKLREAAETAGFKTPFFTMTAWPADNPDKRFLPMFGGYPEAPWTQNKKPLPPQGRFAVTACIMFIQRTGKKVSDVWSAMDEFDSDSIATVIKHKDKPFRIMLFTDLQLWSDILANSEVFRLTDELVDEVRPDMIITLGDNVRIKP